MEALAANPDINRSLPSIQLEKLIVEPLKAATGTSLEGQVIIIDALDECRDDGAVSAIISALSQFTADLRPLKFLITSRPEIRIVKGFRYESLLKKGLKERKYAFISPNAASSSNGQSSSAWP